MEHGLGLALCRSIVEAHDGRSWAGNSAQRGAKFQFTLRAIMNEHRQPSRSETVFIVDDDVSICESLSNLLECDEDSALKHYSRVEEFSGELEWPASRLPASRCALPGNQRR